MCYVNSSWVETLKDKADIKGLEKRDAMFIGYLFRHNELFMNIMEGKIHGKSMVMVMVMVHTGIVNLFRCCPMVVWKSIISVAWWRHLKYERVISILPWAFGKQ